jgi:hypothetical protein
MQIAANRLHRMLIISGGIILSGLTALPAAYLIEASATPPSAGMNDSVSIKLRGQVMPRCDFSGSDAPISFGENAIRIYPVQVSRSFSVNCNAPFVIAMSSEYGGLKRAASISSFEQSLGYEVSLKLLTDSGRAIMLTCDGRDLNLEGAGCARNSGDDTAIGKEALLTVKWRAEKQMMPGSYSDELHLNFYVQD